MSIKDNNTFVTTFLSGLLSGVFISGIFMRFFSTLFGDKHIPKISDNDSELSQYSKNIHIKRENYKIIKEIDNAPLELRKRFDIKGYVLINQNLATVNTELNEFIELMRKYDLYVLDGCNDPEKCPCNFRHKRCRLFMIRKYTTLPGLQFFAPSCSGVTVISPSNKDIVNETPIHEFVQMFLY